MENGNDISNFDTEIIFCSLSSEKLYRAYVSRNVMLTVVATLEFSYFLGLCLPALSKSVYFKCQIGPLHYDCTGHPGQFYVLLCNYKINIDNL